VRKYIPAVWSAWEANMETVRIQRKIKEFRVGRLLFIGGLKVKLSGLRSSSNRWVSVHLFGPFFWITHRG